MQAAFRIILISCPQFAPIYPSWSAQESEAVEAHRIIVEADCMGIVRTGACAAALPRKALIYTAKFVGEMIEWAKEFGVLAKILKATNLAQAREMSFTYGICVVFYRGNTLTHYMLMKKSL